MPGTDAWRGLPDTVFMVMRKPPEGERRPYYGRVLNRLYRNRNGVAQYISCNQGSEFTVFKGTVTWEEE